MECDCVEHLNCSASSLHYPWLMSLSNSDYGTFAPRHFMPRRESSLARKFPNPHGELSRLGTKTQRRESSGFRPTHTHHSRGYLIHLMSLFLLCQNTGYFFWLSALHSILLDVSQRYNSNHSVIDHSSFSCAFSHVFFVWASRSVKALLLVHTPNDLFDQILCKGVRFGTLVQKYLTPNLLAPKI